MVTDAKGAYRAGVNGLLSSSSLESLCWASLTRVALAVGYLPSKRYFRYTACHRAYRAFELARTAGGSLTLRKGSQSRPDYIPCRNR